MCVLCGRGKGGKRGKQGKAAKKTPAEDESALEVYLRCVCVCVRACVCLCVCSQE